MHERDHRDRRYDTHELAIAACHEEGWTVIDGPAKEAALAARQAAIEPKFVNSFLTRSAQRDRDDRIDSRNAADLEW